MSYLQKITQRFAKELIRSNHTYYKENVLQDYFKLYPNVHAQRFIINNERGEKLDCLFCQEYNSQVCVIYAHGLGSNKMEMLTVYQYLKSQTYSFFSFDFSGSGKSSGNYVTYGLKQEEDINAVIEWLESQKKYKKYVLWGRSMGAVAIVLNQSKNPNPKVDCLILDSPFSSFQKIALQFACKKSIIPKFLLEYLIQPLKKYFVQNLQFNPFEIDLSKNIKKLNNLLIMYSKNDTIVSYEHSQILINSCLYKPYTIQITQEHNMPRSKDIYKRIYSFIQACNRNNSRKYRSKSKGISVCSKDHKDYTTLRENYKQQDLQKHSKFVTQSQSLKRKLEISRFFVEPKDCNDSLTSSNERMKVQTSHDSKTGKTQKQWYSSTLNYDVNYQKYKKVKDFNKPTLNILRKNRFKV